MKHFFIYLTLIITACSHSRDLPKNDPYIYRFDLSLKNKKICFIGDTGTGTPEQYLVAKILPKHCDQVRIVGDVIYPSGIKSPQDPQLEKKFFKPYEYFLKKKNSLFIVMGNHDYRQAVTPWIEVANNQKGLFFPNEFYLEVWPEICFLALDTEPFDAWLKNETKKLQIKWLPHITPFIEKKCSGKKLVGWGHHPYLSSGMHGEAMEGEFKSFMDKWIIGKVDSYIAGHDHHLAYEGKTQKTHHFVSGGGSQNRMVLDENSPQKYSSNGLGFLQLSFNKKAQLTYRFIALRETPDPQKKEKKSFTDHIEWELIIP